eukprot:m.196334 g.196334  ORF g.196334 m.196334 type:complete len:66 (-) comp14908_c1_seq6:1170-1367(-)
MCFMLDSSALHTFIHETDLNVVAAFSNFVRFDAMTFCNTLLTNSGAILAVAMERHRVHFMLRVVA